MPDYPAIAITIRLDALPLNIKVSELDVSHCANCVEVSVHGDYARAWIPTTNCIPGECPLAPKG